MLVAVVVLLGVLVAAVLAALAVLVAPHLVVLRRRRVIVNLRSGPAITGTVVRDWGRHIVLAQAVLYEDAQRHPLDGQAVAEKANVAFVQVLPPIDPDAAS